MIQARITQIHSVSDALIPLGLSAVLLSLTYHIFSSRRAANVTSGPSLHELAASPLKDRITKLYPLDVHGNNGQQVLLDHGLVQYWFLGPNDGNKIVLVHGFSMPSIVWKEIARRLASNGFRVLVYDLYGRGYSQAPHTTYSGKLYAEQLAALLRHVGWTKSYVTGVSMGGGIASTFAALYPEMVAGKVALLASAGLLNLPELSLGTRMKMSALSCYLVSSHPIRWFIQRRLMRTVPPSKSRTESQNAAEIVQLQAALLPGYFAALVSSFHHGPLTGVEESLAKIRAANFDVLLIWGTADNTVPFELGLKMKELLPEAELFVLQGVGHDLTMTNPREVSDKLIKFFTK